MKEHERYPSRYFKTEHLDGPIVLKIKHVESVTFADGKLGTAAAIFDEERLLPLNRTNYRAIREIAGGGEDDSQWGGTVIELYPTTTTFGADLNRPCMRVRRPTENGHANKEGEPPF